MLESIQFTFQQLLANPSALIILILLASPVIIAVFQSVSQSRADKRVRDVIYSGAFISSSEFLQNWIVRRGTSGFKHEDGPGCYVILIYDRVPNAGDWSHYDDVYIGQSVRVCQRLYSHLTGKGNGDVYADLRNGRHIYLAIHRCARNDLNAREKSLIRAFKATSSYNKTRGGARRK